MLLALIKADFYQMRSRKSPWVTLTLIVLLTACATWIAIDFTKQTEPTLFQNIANFILFNLPQFVFDPLTIVAIFLAQQLSFNNDNKNRTLINTASYGFSRNLIFIGKVLTTFLTTLVFFGAILLTLFIMLSFLTPHFAIQDMGSLVTGYVLPALPIWLAYSTLFSILPLLTKSYGLQFLVFILVTNIESILTVGQLLLGDQAKSFAWLLEADWILTRLTPLKPLHYFQLNFNWTWIVALLYVAIFALIGMTLFKRSEIK